MDPVAYRRRPWSLALLLLLPACEHTNQIVIVPRPDHIAAGQTSILDIQVRHYDRRFDRWDPVKDIDVYLRVREGSPYGTIVRPVVKTNEFGRAESYFIGHYPNPGTVVVQARDYTGAVAEVGVEVD